MAVKNQIKLTLLGFHPFFYDGIRQYLKKFKEIQLTPYTNGKKNIQRIVKQHTPDVILIDTEIPDIDFIESSAILKKAAPNTAVISFCHACEENEVLTILEKGAKGVVFSTASKEEILKAIKTVAIKKTYYCPSASNALLNVITKRFNTETSLTPRFTPRELQIIRLICKEYTNKDIASKLALSMRTIEEYRTAILKKIGAKNIAGVVMYALKNNLLK